MSVTREAVFECTYASSAQLRTAYVRAWDADEAADLFARELAEEGIAERGDISVRARTDQFVRHSVYAPH
ncbi:MAG TPA: hypothetical protein VFK90_03765 [Anaeromyxobacter sp.]|nr:hypothetical protein [Anaeromyxobacter sp.]